MCDITVSDVSGSEKVINIGRQQLTVVVAVTASLTPAALFTLLKVDKLAHHLHSSTTPITRMWANAQCDGHPLNIGGALY